jgi:transcription antitermination factor NusG
MTRQLLPALRWYAVHTTAGQEGRAARNLARQGYYVAYPFDRIMTRVTLGGQHGRDEAGNRVYFERTVDRWIERPHFSRYIFVALRFVDEPIGPINDTDGVARVVCERMSGKPLEIPGWVMDALLEEALADLAGEVDLRTSRIELEDKHSLLMREVVAIGDTELSRFIDGLGRRVTGIAA